MTHRIAFPCVSQVHAGGWREKLCGRLWKQPSLSHPPPRSLMPIPSCNLRYTLLQSPMIIKEVHQCLEPTIPGSDKLSNEILLSHIPACGQDQSAVHQSLTALLSILKIFRPSTATPSLKLRNEAFSHIYFRLMDPSTARHNCEQQLAACNGPVVYVKFLKLHECIFNTRVPMSIVARLHRRCTVRCHLCMA